MALRSALLRILRWPINSSLFACLRILPKQRTWHIVRSSYNAGKRRLAIHTVAFGAARLDQEWWALADRLKGRLYSCIAWAWIMGKTIHGRVFDLYRTVGGDADGDKASLTANLRRTRRNRAACASQESVSQNVSQV
ncbi:hypothetical protein MGYG_05926 [Nannizzia gypsea CBS 118893]|uniref:Uncharacterized protein n=1 Tax=Arthroderma gypseum (strain ATCC MYA-4604 / CBS 118893) TaxID=535722 RepID=E4UZY9_ARTGP|nr:hypothetical protein MGYG_05926 [Nannizzia gypsea CBS 118893]EFR02926.1 hypothetical protein MGYG_05926 [Nannizzia gypsea CBS 118893]